MLKQEFKLNDGTKPELYVIGQVSEKTEAMTIQISQILDMEDVVKETPHTVAFGIKYIYEEIDNDDCVRYARHMDSIQIYKNYRSMWDKLNGEGK